MTQAIHHAPLIIDRLPLRERALKDEPPIPLDLRIDLGKDPRAFERDEALLEHLRELRRIDVLFTPSNDRLAKSPLPRFAAIEKVCLKFLHAQDLSVVVERLATMPIPERTALIERRRALDFFPEVTDSAAGAFVELFLRCGQARYHLETQNSVALGWAVLALQKAIHSLDFVHGLATKRRGKTTLEASGKGHEGQQPYRDQRREFWEQCQRMAEAMWAKNSSLTKSAVGKIIHEKLLREPGVFDTKDPDRKKKIVEPETIARAIKKPRGAASGVSQEARSHRK